MWIRNAQFWLLLEVPHVFRDCVRHAGRAFERLLLPKAGRSICYSIAAGIVTPDLRRFNAGKPRSRSYWIPKVMRSGPAPCVQYLTLERIRYCSIDIAFRDVPHCE